MSEIAVVDASVALSWLLPLFDGNKTGAVASAPVFIFRQYKRGLILIMDNYTDEQFAIKNSVDCFKPFQTSIAPY